MNVVWKSSYAGSFSDSTVAIRSMFRQYMNIQAVASDCSSSVPAGRCDRSKAPMLSRPRKPPEKRSLPSLSWRFSHQVKLSSSLWKIRRRNSSSLRPSIVQTR